MTKKVLITGGAGFIGRHIVKRCTDLGWTTTVVDNMNSESSLPLNEWHKSVKPVNGSVIFREMDCRDFFKHSNEVFDYVFHLSAVVNGRVFIENQPIAVADDLSIDSEMLNWSVRTKQKKMVLFSSSAAYPIEYQTREEQRKLSEDMLDLSKNVIGKPDLSYGLSKMVLEYLAKLAYEKHGLKSVIYRPFSGFGSLQHISYPYPMILRRIKKWEGEPIEVWGSGEQVRDFIYIEDVIDGIFHFLDKINNADVVNLGTGIGTSFVELIHKMMTIIHPGKDYKINPLLDKPEGCFYRVADITKMNTQGFYPKWSLEDSIKESLKFE